MKNPKNAKNPENAAIDGLKRASVLLGVSLDTLKRLKNSGCPGFRGGRVYPAEVRGWARMNDSGAHIEFLAAHYERRAGEGGAVQEEAA